MTVTPAVTSTLLPAGFGNAVVVSQSWKWLTERFRYLPQVRRFFGEKLPGLACVRWNFQDSEGITPPRC
jgi:hypothetical protein